MMPRLFSSPRELFVVLAASPDLERALLSDPPTENELLDCITATEQPRGSRCSTKWSGN